MPHVPGVPLPDARISTAVNPASKFVSAFLALLLIAFVGARWSVRFGGVQPTVAPQQPQIDVPSPAPDPRTLLPHASNSEPGIAEVDDLAKPWSSKEFYFRSVSGENIAAVLVRLPGGSASQASGYWAFSLNSAFGNCKLEYIADLRKLETDYGFRATHPMVGNPCSRTVFDPLKMSNLPGNVFIRGGIVQGSDLRPPLGIEIQVRGKEILAVRAEKN